MNKAFLPWMGGKSKLAKTIVDQMNHIPHTCYVEPFMGAAHVFFRKEPAKVEVLNDLNSNIPNLFRVLQNHLEEFLRYFKWAVYSREEFKRLNNQNLDGTLTDIQRAARFYYLQKASFGGKAAKRNFGYSTTSPPGLNLLRIEEELSQVHLRLARVNLENLTWQDILKRYDRPHTFFYLDPPYFDHEEDYGPDMFSKDDFKEMATVLSQIKGNFILSLNDTPEVREIFKAFHQEQVNVPYSVNVTKQKRKSFSELLIYPVEYLTSTLPALRSPS